MSDLAYVAICDDAQCGKCYKCKNAELEAEIQWLRELVIHHRIIDRDELVAALLQEQTP